MILRFFFLPPYGPLKSFKKFSLAAVIGSLACSAEALGPLAISSEVIASNERIDVKQIYEFMFAINYTILGDR